MTMGTCVNVSRESKTVGVDKDIMELDKNKRAERSTRRARPRQIWVYLINCVAETGYKPESVRAPARAVIIIGQKGDCRVWGGDHPQGSRRRDQHPYLHSIIQTTRAASTRPFSPLLTPHTRHHRQSQQSLYSTHPTSVRTQDCRSLRTWSRHSTSLNTATHTRTPWLKNGPRISHHPLVQVHAPDADSPSISHR